MTDQPTAAPTPGPCWPQERPKWCPHPTCQYQVSSQAVLCFGKLPEPEAHQDGMNTHRMCLHGAKDDGEWTFDLQINQGDGYAMWRLLKNLFGFAAAPEMAAERDRLLVKNEKLIKALDGLVTAIDDLVSESHGVDGLHLNGDVAPWDELLPGGQYESWLEAVDPARAILDEARKP